MFPEGIAASRLSSSLYILQETKYPDVRHFAFGIPLFQFSLRAMRSSSTWLGTHEDRPDALNREVRSRTSFREGRRRERKRGKGLIWIDDELVATRCFISGTLPQTRGDIGAQPAIIALTPIQD